MSRTATVVVGMDYAITWGGELEDVRLTASGVPKLGEMDALIAEATTDPRWVSGMDVLLDYTRLEIGSFNTVEMQARALDIQSRSRAFGRQRVAVATSPGDSYRKARLLGHLLDFKVEFRAHFFDSLRAARDWLRDEPENMRPHVLPRPLAD